MTLLDEFNYYKSIRQAEVDKIIVEAFGNLPDVVWKTGSRKEKFAPEKWDVTYASAPLIPGAYFSKRPTRKNVDAIKNAPAQCMRKDQITIHIKNGNSSTGVKISDFNVTWSVDYNVMLIKAKTLVEKYIASEGQFNCKYCGQATDNENKIDSMIISRMYDNFRKTFSYCSDRCASHDQMAHEG